jgi:hypothetical protein
MFSLLRHPSSRPQQKRRPRFVVLQVERLEDRFAPATFTVMNTGDLAGDPGSLRGILSGAAGTLNNGDTINFASALNGQTITLGSSLPQIANGLTITGAGLGNGITINGNGFGIFSYTTVPLGGSSQTQVINGLTLKNAATSATASGSAISLGSGGVTGTGTLTVTNSTISGCTSANSTTGALYDNSTGALTVTNCTFSGNSTSGTSGEGTAVWFRTAPATLTNVTISGNSNTMQGAAIDVVGTGSLTVINTIVSNNMTAGAESDITFAGAGMVGATSSNNLIGTINFGTVTPGPLVNGMQGNIIGVNNPMLGPLQNNGGPTFTMEVLAGSMALLNGTATGAPASDQRGVSRTGGINIGAYQASATTLMVAGFPSPQVTGTAGTFTVTALDPFGKTAIGFRDMVQFTSSDAKATLPTAYTFVAGDNGVHMFSATFNTAGTQSLTATDATTPTINGTQSAIVINASTPTANKFFAIGAGAGGGPEVVVYNAATGGIVSAFFAFTPTFMGGVQVAVADINGDGVPDIICAAGAGGGPQVIVVDGTKLNQIQANGQIANSALISSFFAYAPTFTGGVNVAAAVVNGKPEIVLGAGATGGPQVLVIDGTKVAQVQSNGMIAPAAVLASFFAYTPTFTGGVRVAIGDVNGDKVADIICGPGAGGGPQVIVVDGTKFSQLLSNGQIANAALLASFFAFQPTFTGGVFVSGGVTGSNGQFNLIVSQDAGGSPLVEILNGAQLGQVQSNGQIASSAVLSTFVALPPSFMGGVRVGFNGAFGSGGKPAILTAAGPTGGPEVNPFDAATLNTLGAFFALPSGFTGGVFIAG